MAWVSVLMMALILEGSPLPPKSYKIVIEDRMILLFDDDVSASNMDTRMCYNATGTSEIYRKIRRLVRKGRNPVLEMSEIPAFFGTADFSPTTAGHYTYNGRPINAFCERPDLIIIKSVH